MMLAHYTIYILLALLVIYLLIMLCVGFLQAKRKIKSISFIVLSITVLIIYVFFNNRTFDLSYIIILVFIYFALLIVVSFIYALFKEFRTITKRRKNDG